MLFVFGTISETIYILFLRKMIKVVTFNVHEKYPNMLPEKTQKTDKPGLDYKNSCQQE